MKWTTAVHRQKDTFQISEKFVFGPQLHWNWNLSHNDCPNGVVYGMETVWALAKGSVHMYVYVYVYVYVCVCVCACVCVYVYVYE